ncbi:AMP-binding protein [Streptomyces sp. NPDC012389]|uniref:AMP-binding protein n=1 Tax=Streptomyces sp. NPDC012389 TaxID=3364830 RepID=UPI0036EF9BA2
MSPERISDAVERLRHIVASVLELDLAEVPAEASFHRDLKMDSLEKVEFAARVEWAFGVALSDEEASSIDSALAAAELLDARVSLPAGAGAGVAGAGAGVAGSVRPPVPGAARSAAGTPAAVGSVPSSPAGLRTAPSSPVPALPEPSSPTPSFPTPAPSSPAGLRSDLSLPAPSPRPAPRSAVPAASTQAARPATAPASTDSALTTGGALTTFGAPTTGSSLTTGSGRATGSSLTTGPDPSAAIDLVERLTGRHLAAGRGERTAYLDPDLGAVSYRALHEAARGYAGALLAHGVAPGARALVVAEDSAATVAAVLGLWWHGCVPVPVSPMLGEADRALVAADCAAEVIHLDTAPADPPAGTVLLTGDAVRTGIRTGHPNAANRPDLARPSTAHLPGRAALIQYTSGSTGRPKGVRHATSAITAMLDGFGALLALRADDTVLSTARMSFGYGFGSSVLCALDAGATTALIRGAVDPHTVRAALRRHRPTVLCSVPRLYAALLDTLQPGDDAVAALRLCLSAGENCPAALNHRIQDVFGAPVMNCLGATEVMHVVVATPPDRPMPGRAGLAVPGATATVRDEHGRPVPDGTEGRLHIVGPTVALGYLDRPDDDRITFADGGAYTGDLVRREADGTLTHLCRADDILNLGGYKVPPAEIEAVIRTVARIRDCAVVGGLDADGLECAVAFVVPEAGADEETIRRALRAAVRADLALYKRPARVEFVSTLPATATGKVAAYRLREQAS